MRPATFELLLTLLCTLPVYKKLSGMDQEEDQQVCMGRIGNRQVARRNQNYRLNTWISVNSSDHVYRHLYILSGLWSS